MNSRENCVLGHLKELNRLLPRYRREIFEENIEAVTGFEVVNECLDGNTGAPENWSSAHFPW